MCRPPLRLVIAWFTLVLLLAANIVLAQAGVGLALTLAVAAAMAFIVLGVFMELACKVTLFWVFAGAGFFWLSILFGLTAADYLTRYSFAPT